jgi:hypothetical protein
MSRAPRDWTFEGFDGTNWVVVDSGAGETGWLGVETRSYDVASPGAYGAYRLRVSDDSDARSGMVVVSMGNLQLNGPNASEPTRWHGTGLRSCRARKKTSRS